LSAAVRAPPLRPRRNSRPPCRQSAAAPGCGCWTAAAASGNRDRAELTGERWRDVAAVTLLLSPIGAAVSRSLKQCLDSGVMALKPACTASTRILEVRQREPL